MSDAKKKPSMALVIEAARKGKSDDDAPDSSAPESGEDEDYATSTDELADVLGIADDKREAFADAFRAACMACK